MNERIRELADQAWQYADDNSRDGDGRHGHLYRDKLAELIVRECIQQLRYKSAQLMDVDYFPEYKEQLEKHFGIKE
jgi:hypothetical protein